MDFWLQRQLCLPWLARLPSTLKLPFRREQNAESGDLSEVKPLHLTRDAGYERLWFDVLEQIRIQAKRRKVDYRVAKSVNDGIEANKDLQASGFSYRISVQSCH